MNDDVLHSQPDPTKILKTHHLDMDVVLKMNVLCLNTGVQPSLRSIDHHQQHAHGMIVHDAGLEANDTTYFSWFCRLTMTLPYPTLLSV